MPVVFKVGQGAQNVRLRSGMYPRPFIQDTVNRRSAQACGSDNLVDRYRAANIHKEIVTPTVS
jgi:hypothetical protein